MTFDEGRWRARELTRTIADRVRFRLRKPRWPEANRSRIAEGIAERLVNGRTRCVVDPTLAESLRQEVLARWPDAASDAAALADRILAGNYDLLGYRGLRFDDWHSDPVHHRRAPRVCWAEVPYLDPSIGDHKIIWELNRHQHWLRLARASWLTRDERYAREIVTQMDSWLDDNPPMTGINWASMLEIALRTISWTMSAHFLAATGCALPARFLDAIDRQLTHVEQHLSYYFSPNTHLTGEGLALYVVGQAFPELPASGRWVTTGRDVLLREIERQVLPDGGHAERSMHYQRYTLDFYLLALLTARRTADEDAEPIFANAVTRLAEFTRAMADDDGRLPLIGDDDGGMLWPIAGRDCNDVRDSLAVAAVVLDRYDFAPWGLSEEVFWIAGREALAADPTHSAPLEDRSAPLGSTFAETGYVVLRDVNGDHAIFDTGAHGYMNGGHAHADALSVTLRLGRHPFVVDPGTSTYTIDPQLRDRMRRSFNHNTLAIDDRPQATPAGPFHWLRTATARLIDSRHVGAFDWAEAVHDGYAPLEHRRSIVRADGAGWLFVDEVRGPQHDQHRAAAHWHFDPRWMLHADGGGRLRAAHGEGNEAWLIVDAGDIRVLHGDEQSGLGWFAPVYGTLVPTWTARIERTGGVPFSILTWAGEGNGTDIPEIERVAVNPDGAGDAIAVRVICGEFTSLYLLRPGTCAPQDSRACDIHHYQTNARVLHVRSRGSRMVALDLADASHALALTDGFVSVAADGPMRDLHLAVSDGMLQLATSQPPRQLRVESGSDACVVADNDWMSSSSGPLFHFGAPFAFDDGAPAGCEEFSPLRERSW